MCFQHITSSKNDEFLAQYLEWYILFGDDDPTFYIHVQHNETNVSSCRSEKWLIGWLVSLENLRSIYTRQQTNSHKKRYRPTGNKQTIWFALLPGGWLLRASASGVGGRSRVKTKTF